MYSVSVLHNFSSFRIFGSDLENYLPERYFGVSKQANFQTSISHQAQPVARSAKMLRHGSYKANLPFVAWNFESLEKENDDFNLECIYNSDAFTQP